MGIIKSTYDTIKELQFRGPNDEKNRHLFGKGISKYQCIICGDKRKDVDKDGVCPDCNAQFPIKENKPVSENLTNATIKEESYMNINQRIKKQLIDLSTTLNEKLSDIMSEISNAISNKDIDKVQSIAADGNFVKESQKTIDKILDEFEDKFESEQIPFTSETNTVTIDVFNPPNLSFTKIIDSKLGSDTPKNWSNLIRTTLKLAISRGLSIDELRRISAIHLKNGFYSDEGFKFEPSINISYQELDSNKSFDNVVKILKHLSVGFTMKIYWRNREGSQYPGKYGIINWKP